MRTQLLLVLLFMVLSCTRGFSQGSYKFRPLKEFGNDTIAYMEKNYGKSNVYPNKPLEKVLKDADIPFRSYIVYAVDGHLAMVFLFTISAKEVEALYRAGKPIFGVCCDLAELYDYENMDKAKAIYAKASRLSRNLVFDLDKTSIELLKDLRINFALYYDQRVNFKYFKIK